MNACERTQAGNQVVQRTRVPVPEISDDEVLVNVKAFGVGIHDRYFIPQDAVFPYVIGTEAAGEMMRSDGKVQRLREGARVLLMSALQPKGGCWAEYLAVPQAAVVPIPDEMAFTTAAAIPIAGKTAWSACVRCR